MSTERTEINTAEVVAPAQPEAIVAATEAPVTTEEVAPIAADAAATTTTEDAAKKIEGSAEKKERTKRDRSAEHDRNHHHEGGKSEADHHHKHSRHESSHHSSRPQALSAAAKKESELSSDTCVRFGIFEPRREISKEEFMDEMDAIRMTGAVEQIVLEPFVPGQDHYFWARIYFNSKENADIAATELNIPLRKSKWRLSVTQRLPLKGANSGEMGTIPAFQPFVCEPVDTVVVDTQEGYVAFSTDELYASRSATEFIDAKRNGRLIRRLICKHFDAERRIPCRYGVGCSFMHIKATAVDRLLRTVSHRAPLRFTKQDEDIQVGTWEYERRHDTLLVRHLSDEMSQKDLSYMFANCPGFISCSVFANKDEKNKTLGTRYGLIRFESKAAAMQTLLQTHDSNLNIGFFGVMEDVRRMQMHAVKDAKLLPSTFDTSQQTHMFFSPITNQVVGQPERRNFNNNPHNNNNYSNNNGGNNYNNNNYNNNNRSYNGPGTYNGPNNNGFNNNNGGGNNFNNPYNRPREYGNGGGMGMNNNGNQYGRYNNQGRQHDYGNDRYNSNPNNGGDFQPSIDGPLTAPRNDDNNGLFSSPAAGSSGNNNNRGSSNNAGSSNNNAGANTPAEPVPFPALPAGWGYGVSRRNGKYYFFEHGSKAPTTFKHPITGEKYGGN